MHWRPKRPLAGQRLATAAAEWQWREEDAALTSGAATNKLFAEKPCDARIEFAVECCPVEARGHIGANARYGGHEFRRAWRQEDKVAGRHDTDVRRPGKAAGDASRAR